MNKFIAFYSRKPYNPPKRRKNKNYEDAGTNHRGEPKGVIVATRNEQGSVCFGWAAHSSDDPQSFKKKKAIEIALGRANSGRNKPVPSSLEDVATSYFMKRCEDYFQEKELSLEAFQMFDRKKLLVYVVNAETWPTSTGNLAYVH